MVMEGFMRTFRTGPILAATLLSLAFASPSGAVDLPCSTAKLIVPWGAGGDTDIVNRIIADGVSSDGMSPALQVVNVPGQGGNKGAKEAREAKPDGCTLFAIHQSAITSYFTGRVDFTWDAFEPVALLARTPPIIGAYPGLPYGDLKGLIAAAKAAPGTILAGATLGSTSHFWLLLLEDAADIQFKYVPYEGTRERMTALLANTIQIAEINLAAAQQYIQSKELNALGIYTETRNPTIPGVLTAKEQGIDLVAGTDRGIVAPKGTSPEVLDYWTGRLEKVMKSPAIEASFAEKGTLIVFTGGKDYAAYMAATLSKWQDVAKKVGVYKRND